MTPVLWLTACASEQSWTIPSVLFDDHFHVDSPSLSTMTFKAIASPIFDRLLRVHTDPRIDHDPPFRPLQQCQHPRDVGSLEPTWAQQLDFGLWLRCQCQCEEYSSSSFKKKNYLLYGMGHPILHSLRAVICSSRAHVHDRTRRTQRLPLVSDSALPKWS